MAKRRDLFDPSDPANLQPEQRLAEVAAILAAGVIHMRERRAATVRNVHPCRNWVRGTTSPNRLRKTCMPKVFPESGRTRLELSCRTRPNSQCG